MNSIKNKWIGLRKSLYNAKFNSSDLNQNCYEQIFQTSEFYESNKFWLKKKFS